MSGEGASIGIDLGTTYSCVGVWKNERVEIIANDEGDRTTPSYVAFNDSERLIGNAAKSQVAMNASNTVFDVKRLIGRKYCDTTVQVTRPKKYTLLLEPWSSTFTLRSLTFTITDNVQADMRQWPFTVIESPAGKPIIEVTFKGEVKQFAPEEISSMVLMKMKEVAEAYLGHEVKNAVITVPARFNHSQRQATRNAGVISGLNVLRVINEPSAAAIAYSFHNGDDDEERNVLIFDLGGGTLDVSLIIIRNKMLEVMATAGDTHLGGDDFDTRLVQYFTTEFKRKFRKDMTQNQRALRRLRIACERAKRTLSSSTEAHIEINSLFEGIDFNSVITRSRFEDMNIDYFCKCIDPVEEVLKDSNMSKFKVHEVVLVCGSTRIPKVQELLADFFGGKELNKSINPDEAVASGAAIMAAIMSGQNPDSHRLEEFRLLEATSHSLGIEGTKGVMTTLVKRNTVIPTKKRRTLPFNQSAVLLNFYEGEHSLTKDNLLLGELLFDEIHPTHIVLPHIDGVTHITLDIDVNGEITTGGRSIIISEGSMSVEEIERLRLAAVRYQSEDGTDRLRVAAKNALENYNLQVLELINNNILSIMVSDRAKEMVVDAVTGTTQWLQNNQRAEREEFEEKLKALEALVGSTLSTLGSRKRGRSFRSCS
jgi:heat shock 70kDa protein 1/2/6/8